MTLWKLAQHSRSPRPSARARPDGAERSDQRRGGDVPATRSIRNGSPSTTSCTRRPHQLPAGRVRRRHPAGQQADGLLRRHRRPDDAGAAAGGGRQAPALPDRARRRGARSTTCPGVTAELKFTRSAARRHLPRQDHQVERPGDRQGERRRHAAVHRHRRRASLRGFGYDLHLRRLPGEGLARMEVARWA